MLCSCIKQKGLSLFEVLLAWGLLMLISWGVLTFYFNTTYKSMHALWKSIAVTRVSAMAERLLILRYHSITTQELQRWNQVNKHLLPHGKGFVQYHHQSQLCRVIVRWVEKKAYQIGIYTVC